MQEYQPHYFSDDSEPPTINDLEIERATFPYGLVYDFDSELSDMLIVMIQSGKVPNISTKRSAHPAPGTITPERPLGMRYYEAEWLDPNLDTTISPEAQVSEDLKNRMAVNGSQDTIAFLEYLDFRANLTTDPQEENCFDCIYVGPKIVEP